eukprot:CAMPEP_0180133654 /NCGR_PEP_ID=MMETSP0986-20121125/9666_1 /TAXON_ID=697907 /ORGANISM="non described non described, Strain CCMP2293" /LENGTH=55 /DNA_ID=CAMNT_0022073807 /DNA_START=773 /DNA_END=941 /DNA_ORIENTATION=-
MIDSAAAFPSAAFSCERVTFGGATAQSSSLAAPAWAPTQAPPASPPCADPLQAGA